MLAAVWLMLSSLLYSLQLSTGSFPRPLTEQEERHYLELSAKGDLEARNILIERNLRLVAHIMKKYYAQASDQEDLISIGTIGLIKGITTFDCTKGARLATYAARCVENEILMYFRSQKKSGQDVSLSDYIETGTDGARICWNPLWVESGWSRFARRYAPAFLHRSGKWCECAMAWTGIRQAANGRWHKNWESAAVMCPELRSGRWKSCGGNWRNNFLPVPGKAACVFGGCPV